MGENAPRMAQSADERLRHTGAGADDEAIVEGLRAGREAAFATLLDRYGASMLRVARLHVRDRAVAEEVVQETWLAVLQGIDGFEGRSSLRTWLFTILTNRARSRGEREGRGVPFSALVSTAAAVGEPAVDPDRFLGLDDARWPHHWAAPPRAWPEDSLLADEAVERDQRGDLRPAREPARGDPASRRRGLERRGGRPGPADIPR